MQHVSDNGEKLEKRDEDIEKLWLQSKDLKLKLAE